MIWIQTIFYWSNWRFLVMWYFIILIWRYLFNFFKIVIIQIWSYKILLETVIFKLADSHASVPCFISYLLIFMFIIIWWFFCIGLKHYFVEVPLISCLKKYSFSFSNWGTVRIFNQILKSFDGIVIALLALLWIKILS